MIAGAPGAFGSEVIFNSSSTIGSHPAAGAGVCALHGDTAVKKIASSTQWQYLTSVLQPLNEFDTLPD